ncbi:hypothetical protein KHS38_19580 [Mucilaginibacter sp. Bleaf8]|uniref:DUF3108 domain-containing protein n=1 Tax=Mucilaginibacter sp. Bleaf8 TaxID=2834430 RepID=UPI001BCD0A03|nr:hypothetical protein [Mucilaginibacter sp. Bleaf8]MBS7566616.1 hypothetical protein [Mucilaginibacter sp. Bleaf8]
MLKLAYTGLLITGLCSAALSPNAFAQTHVDTVNLKSHKLQTSYLKPGLRQYLVYMQSPARPKTLNLSYWVRDVKSGTQNGEKIFTVSQHWYANDTSAYRTYYAVNRAADFAPVYQKETVRSKTKAYNWGSDKITGTDTVANNEAKGFELAFTEPNYNWNLDIETFEMLPLAAGKTFAISFYDAGLGKPGYVTYKVTGSEKITLLDNAQTDCWKLVTEGKAPNGSTYTQAFWLSKKGHEFLKEEDSFNGAMRVKIKMPVTTPDVVSLFKH